MRHQYNACVCVRHQYNACVGVRHECNAYVSVRHQCNICAAMQYKRILTIDLLALRHSEATHMMQNTWR